MSEFKLNAKYLKNSAALPKQYCKQNTPFFGIVCKVLANSRLDLGADGLPNIVPPLAAHGAPHTVRAGAGE